MSILLPRNLETQAYWEQSDGSIIDLYGNVMSSQERLQILETVENLPITLEKERIKQVIGNNLITILQWETWSGKSTQLSKFLAEDGSEIITVGNKVMAVMWLASRVSKEKLAETGNPEYSVWYGVWYRTGEENSSNRKSPISFHTDGTELMRRNMSWSNCDVLILDEVHNFSIPTEILAMKIRNEMLKTKKDMRLVIMSATLDPQIFQDYFKDIENDIPFLSIPGRIFPVEHYYNNAQNIEKTILTQAKKKNNILVFCEWKQHILETIASLESQTREIWHEVEILPLHSELSIYERQNVVTTPRFGVTKIIVATNIAEESITIPYINTVIDLGKEKSMKHNKFGIPELRSENIAKANSKQRAGRAGRTQKWEYIRMNDFDYEKLQNYPNAPIQNQLLEREILLNINGGINILEEYYQHKDADRKLFMHDISERLLHLAYDNLAEMWLIYGNGTITPLGKEALKYPMWVSNAVSFIESLKRKCSYDMLLITSILENGGFLEKWGWSKLKLESQDDWDVFAYVEIFRMFTDTQISDDFAHELIQLGCNPKEIKKFIEENDWEQKLYEIVDLSKLGVNEKRIEKIYRHVKNIKTRLKTSWIALENTWTQDDIKISLLTWYRNNQYDYIKSQTENKYCLINKDYSKLEFKHSNTSTISPVKENSYFWIPFIIGWEEEKPDINIVFHIFEISKKHLAEVEIHDVDWDNQWHKKSTKKKKNALTQQTAMEVYVEQIDDFTHNVQRHNFKNVHDAQQNFIENIAPNLMIAYNPYVKKFIASKGPDFNLWKFRQLLKKVLSEEVSRVNTNNLEKTKRSFIDDTIVLDHFLESTDPHIEQFLGKRKTLPYIELSKKDSTPKLSEEVEESNHKLEESKKSFDKLLHKIPEKINIAKMKQTLWARYVDGQNYDEIFKNILKISALQPEQIKEIIVQMNTIAKSKIKLQKTRKNLRTLEAVKELLHNVILWNNTIDKLEDYSISTSELSFINKELFYSQDEAKQHHLNPLEKHIKPNIGIEEIKSMLKRIDKTQHEFEVDTKKLTQSIHVQDIDHAKNLYNSFVEYFQNIYSPKEFVAFSVNDKILSLTRKVFAHHDNHKFNYKFEIYNFVRKHSTESIESKIPWFDSVNKLDDIYYTLEIYNNQIAQQVRDSNDIELVQSRILELKEKLSEHGKLKAKIS